MRIGPILVAALLAAPACARSGPESLEAVASAMGAGSLRTLEYAGSGRVFNFGQAVHPDSAWPAMDADAYSVAIDLQRPALRLETVISQPEGPPRGGGGQPVAGEQRRVQTIGPGAPADQMREIWLHPHALVRAALASGATLEGNAFSFTVEGREISATVSPEGLVESARMTLDDPVLGDVVIERSYSEYAEFDGIRVPMRIVERRGDHPTLDVTLQRVTPNPSLELEVAAVPADGATQAPPFEATVESREIAGGVWQISGGTRNITYNSFAVEFADHVILLEAPLNETRSLALLAEVKRLFPDKPIRAVVNTHQHFDHAGGLRTFVAEGIPIITHEINRPFYERAWARPRTLAPDRLARSPREPVFETMTDSKVLTDGSRTLELHLARGNGHNEGIIFAFLPAERILIQTDIWNAPPRGQPRDPSRTPEYWRNLYDNIRRLGLDVSRIVPIHGPVGESPAFVSYTVEELRQAIGEARPPS